MNINRAGAGVTLAVAFLLAGCSGTTPGTTPTSSSTGPSASSSPRTPSASVTTSSAEPTDLAAQQAEAVYREYLRAQTRDRKSVV